MKGLELKIPPLGVFVVAGLAMWGLAAMLPAAAFGFPWRVAVVVLLLIAGGVTGVAGVLAFHRYATSVDPTRPDKASSLVVASIYRHTRNPMYLGLVLVLAAWAVYLSNLFSLLVIPAVIAYLTRFQIKPEEQALLDKFGAEYALYLGRVRRWL